MGPMFKFVSMRKPSRLALYETLTQSEYEEEPAIRGSYSFTYVGSVLSLKVSSLLFGFFYARKFHIYVLSTTRSMISYR